MKNKIYTTPDCEIAAVSQGEALCGSYDFTAGSLYNGTDNNDNDFFTE